MSLIDVECSVSPACLSRLRAEDGELSGMATGPRGVESPALWNYCYMDLLAAVVLGIFVFLTAVLVIGLFVWGAIQDGQEDRAVQARLGIRRRTRLGR